MKIGLMLAPIHALHVLGSTFWRAACRLARWRPSTSKLVVAAVAVLIVRLHVLGVLLYISSFPSPSMYAWYPRATSWLCSIRALGC